MATRCVRLRRPCDRLGRSMATRCVRLRRPCDRLARSMATRCVRLRRPCDRHYAPHMSEAPDVLAPAKLGPITLRNRVIKSATFEARTPNPLVSDDLIEYH